jgi:hypothetical protein
MGSQYKKLKDIDISFIKKQHIFYIATSSGKEVNLSPKGYDSIRVLNSETLLYLDYPGSANRTGRDVENGGEVTLLFNSFEYSEAKVLRVFAKGQIVDREDENFIQYISSFGMPEHFIRQMFIFKIYAVETSCGASVPIMEFVEERKELRSWVKSMARKNKLEEYIKEHETPPNLEEI